VKQALTLRYSGDWQMINRKGCNIYGQEDERGKGVLNKGPSIYEE